jgi:hypothetical protein
VQLSFKCPKMLAAEVNHLFYNNLLARNLKLSILFIQEKKLKMANEI